jgi:hypothetical protein
MQQVVGILQTTAAATLTAALIGAAGRPHSVDEAMRLFQDVHFSLFPQANHGAYQAWQKNKDTGKVHA